MSDAEFVELLRDELPRIQRLARLLVGDDAEDVVAEAIARSLPTWRAGQLEDPGAYVRRVVVNLAKRRWRRRRLASKRDHHALAWTTATADEVDVAERDRTLRAVRALSPRRRAVVVLRFYDDLPEAEIAQVLGISVGTVKSQLSRALEQLRADLVTLEG